MNDIVLSDFSGDDWSNEQEAFSSLLTVEQKGAFCNYLISSTLPADNLSVFRINDRLFEKFVHSAESLSRVARLSLAISLLSDVLMVEQERSNLAILKRFVMTPTLLPKK